MIQPTAKNWGGRKRARNSQEYRNYLVRLASADDAETVASLYERRLAALAEQAHGLGLDNPAQMIRAIADGQLVVLPVHMIQR